MYEDGFLLKPDDVADDEVIDEVKGRGREVVCVRDETYGREGDLNGDIVDEIGRGE